ncbi:hypothetical protein ACM5ME_11595 [Bacillus subtilis]
MTNKMPKIAIPLSTSSTPIRSFVKVGCNEDIAITLLFSVP